MDLQTIEAAYNVWPPSCDADGNPTRDRDASVLRRQPFQLSGATVLELGCGTGKNTSWLAEHARQVVAIDFSEHMLERARRRVTADRVRFVKGNIVDPWPAPDGSADLVVIDLVLEHVADLRTVFREAWRVLRPGTSLFICELHPYCQMRGSQARFTDPATGTELRIPAFRHDVADFVNGGVDAGFRVVHLGEWRYPGAEATESPRLLSLTCVKE